MHQKRCSSHLGHNVFEQIIRQRLCRYQCSDPEIYTIWMCLRLCSCLFLGVCTCVGLAIKVCDRIWPYIWWFSCPKYRVYIWFWPTLHIQRCNLKQNQTHWKHRG
jgi:hypothetical protein